MNFWSKMRLIYKLIKYLRLICLNFRKVSTKFFHLQSNHPRQRYKYSLQICHKKIGKKILLPGSPLKIQKV